MSTGCNNTPQNVRDLLHLREAAPSPSADFTSNRRAAQDSTAATREATMWASVRVDGEGENP
ncbi:hypothetical protein caldi_02000 [Caldinitratiruptor microaerophilus]|uniref:Uncharacterized protein n=1 Tax=Caldinitratiruptor microaerophilus TaxID=671077 RepID=A0AA35CKR0_9FIRM|nr:hypothetical protein caldi_02000 [Caldinitratiruptor microaerophilus]